MKSEKKIIIKVSINFGKRINCVKDLGLSKFIDGIEAKLNLSIEL